MGVVYEAEHIDIERRVALKILRFDLSQQTKMAQVFRDEARAASRMGSDNIVEIYDFGELSDGRLFFCMELLDGTDLVPQTEEDWTAPGDLIGLLRQVCKGLSAAHETGVVHRDIKPENIITVEKNGRPGMVKIVDFGISAMLAAGQQDGGTIAGTPHYMAPEQITAQEFDGRLDVYAVGCTAYELLVGQPPFDAEELTTLLQMHLSEPPPPPSQVRPDREIPPALEKVILQCLAKSPHDRYQNMVELELALCEAQIEAGLTSMWDDLPLPETDDVERRDRILRDMPSSTEFGPRRRGWLWPAVAATGTLGGAALGAFLVFGQGPTDLERSVVEELTLAAKDAASKANYVYPPPSTPKADTAYRKVIELEGLDGPADRLGDEAGESLRTEFAGTLVGFGDQLWDVAGARPLARDWYIQALAFDPDNARAFERAGVSAGFVADFRDRAASTQFTTAELILGRALGAAIEGDQATKAQLEQEYAAAMAEAGDDELSVSAELGIRSAARRAGLKGLAPKEEVGDNDAVIDAAATEAAALLAEVEAQGPAEDEMVLEEEGAEGEEATEEAAPSKSRRRSRTSAFAKQRELLGTAKRDPGKSADLAQQGRAALRAGRRREAENLFNQALSFNHRNAAALMGLSDVYFDTGRNSEAVKYAERAVKAASSNGGYRIKLGDAYYKVLRYRDALTQYQKAKDLGQSRADGRITKVNGKLGK